MQSRSVEPGIIHVAVVDDDESTCRSYGRLLGAAGFQPIPYPSAEAFLGDTRRPRLDCLVLDIQCREKRWGGPRDGRHCSHSP